VIICSTPWKKWRDKPAHEVLDAFMNCLLGKYGKDVVEAIDDQPGPVPAGR
jgi:hypothetical protein